MPGRREAVLAAALLAVPVAGSSQVPAVPPPLVISADGAHPVVAGLVAATASRPAERAQLLIAVRAEATTAANEGGTSSLAALLRRTLPGLRVTPEPTGRLGGGAFRLGGGPYGGFVRVDVPAPLDVAALRGLVDRIVTAIGRLDAKDPARSAQVVAVGHLYAACAPFETLASAAATARVRELARALGTPTAPHVLADQTYPGHPIDGPAPDRPLCGRDARLELPTAVDLPLSSAFTERRTYGFAQPVRFAPLRPNPDARAVPDFWAGPAQGPRLRLRSNSPLLTLEGHATSERTADETFYDYRGPNGRYFRGSVSVDQLAATRARVRALGIPDGAIATELDPSRGSWYVGVRAKASTPQDAVVNAIAGASEAERHAVRAAPVRQCAPDAVAVGRALADAAARAQRVAASLGTVVDVAHPVAVALGSGAPFGSCAADAAAQAPYTESLSRHVSGSLRAAPSDGQDVDDVVVQASFPIADRGVRGPSASAPARDLETSYVARFGFQPPAVEYPQAASTGTARRERALEPQRVRISLQLSPDNANAFRPIDPRFPAALAARLGAHDAQYTAAFVSSQNNGPNGEPEPDALRFVAVVPYRGERTVADTNDALRTLSGVGYGGFGIVSQRDDCQAAAGALARDTIRAAAAQARVPRGARLVGIDLRGPFAADGACHAGPGGEPGINIRAVTIPLVRLAAYARVSYGR